MNTWLSTGLLILLLFTTTVGLSQNLFVTKEKIEQELQNRGLEVDEVYERLREKGVDMAYIDQNNITQEQIEVIQGVILEMEEEKTREEIKLFEEGELEREEEDDEEMLEDEELSEEGDSLLLTEEIVEEEIDLESLVYGQQLFRQDILSVQASSEEIKAPDSYILGPGDELVVSVWGRSQFDNEYEIDGNGYIKILNGAKRVYLKGLSLGQAKEKLFRFFNEYYAFTQGQFDVALNFSRTVKIRIYGDVYENPGAIALPAFNSAFNALAAVKGTNDIGSLRKIQLQKADGRVLTLDVYKFMQDPSISDDYYLEENDVILVPVAAKIIKLEGAVRRPMEYELVDREGLKALLSYAGGFSENAFKRKIQISRFVDDQMKILDVDWRNYERGSREFELLHGDVVTVGEIEKEAENVVEVVGEVYKPGIYQKSSNMTVSELIDKAGITPQSSIEIAFLTRTNTDGKVEYRKLNLQKILNNVNHPDNLVLNNKDVIEIWEKSRFTDEVDIAIDGAVRFPGKFSYDESKSIRVKDAILLAGGLRRDASNYAIIHRNDPLNPKIKKYKTIDDLDEVFINEATENNFILSPFDSIVIKSKNTFLEESFVRIEGAVNSPGEFQYGSDMTIKDLLTLAGGFKMAASTNNIEISRVIIRNNQPTRTTVANLEMDREFNVLSNSRGEYKLEPYDNIAVRYIKEFQLQKRVFMEGEVQFPGPYAISKENEQILSIIERAGGLTDEAFPAGATLIRDEQDYGSVVIKLEEIISNPDSEFNFFVKNGDKIFVPKIKEFVTIKGATRAREVVGESSINDGNLIHVPFHKGKDAMFYINEYAGGLHENADKQRIFVEHANGEIKRPRQGFLIKRFPKVYQGSVISVGFKSLEKNKEDEKEEVNWTKVLGDSVAQAMSILTLILLITRLD